LKDCELRYQANCRLADFEKTFIQVIVYNYTTLREEGDEAGVKAKGKVMTKGKDYEVQDGDILLIKAGAAKG
jgi:obg-like ATPase 1